MSLFVVVDVGIELRALVRRHASKSWRLVIGPLTTRLPFKLARYPSREHEQHHNFLLLPPHFSFSTPPNTNRYSYSAANFTMATLELQNVLSNEKSTSGFKVALHPLVILTISDYLTRHTLRNQPGPLIGALLGQQNESHVSIEHAFEINALTGQVDVPWFMSRLEDSK